MRRCPRVVCFTGPEFGDDAIEDGDAAVNTAGWLQTAAAGVGLVTPVPPNAWDGLESIQKDALRGPFFGPSWGNAATAATSIQYARDFKVQDLKGKTFIKPKKVR